MAMAEYETKNRPPECGGPHVTARVVQPGSPPSTGELYYKLMFHLKNRLQHGLYGAITAFIKHRRGH